MTDMATIGPYGFSMVDKTIWLHIASVWLIRPYSFSNNNNNNNG